MLLRTGILMNRGNLDTDTYKGRHHDETQEEDRGRRQHLPAKMWAWKHSCKALRMAQTCWHFDSTLSLQNCEKMGICYTWPICGTLLWNPRKQTQLKRRNCLVGKQLLLLGSTVFKSHFGAKAFCLLGPLSLLSKSGSESPEQVSHLPWEEATINI